MKNLFFKNILENQIDEYILNDNFNSFIKFTNFNKLYFSKPGINNNRNIVDSKNVYKKNNKIIKNVLIFFIETILESDNYLTFYIQLKNLYNNDLQLLFIFIIHNTVFECIKMSSIFKRVIHRKKLNNKISNKIILNNENIEMEYIDKYNSSEILYLYNHNENNNLNCWWFSSYELLKLLKQGLTYQIFMIPNPYVFKNPYSNVELSYNELITIYDVIVNTIYKYKPVPIWLRLFRTAQFKIEKYEYISGNILNELSTISYIESLDEDEYIEQVYHMLIEHNLKHIFCKKCIKNNYNKVYTLFSKVLTTYLLYVNQDDSYNLSRFKESKIIIANITRNNLWLTKKSHTH
jgi:hypothetical protein